MKPSSIKCPSCGAEHSLHNPGIITVVCDYCGNAVYWDEEKIKDAGKQAVLPEGLTRLYRGAGGTLFNRRFLVLGRVRYSFGQGFWDEWYLEFADGRLGWLSEDNFELAWETRAKDADLPSFEELWPGNRVVVGEREYVIEEKGEAVCLGVEGKLPKAVFSEETYRFADGSSPEGIYTLGIEFDNDPPTVFTGKWLKYAAMHLDDEGLKW